MPTFYTESLDIDPEEFVDDCSLSEIQELVKYLKESELIQGTDGTPSDCVWNDAVVKLLDSNWKLSVEDERTILNICSKLVS